MPGRFPDPPLATNDAVDGLAKHLRAVGRFAFDTEFVSENTFEPVLCLIQIATRERLVAIDPLARGIRLDPLWDVLLDPNVEVVMHAAGEDLRICLFQTGQLPERVFDTQIAAGLAGYSYPLSLVNLVSATLGITLSGGETRTDWRRRPLSEAQVRYALDDVAHLLDVADHLQERLNAWDREAWAEAEFAAFIKGIRRRGDEDRWRRLPGAGSLSRRSLEIARRLYDWRQDQARVSNRPARQIMRDDLIVGIARRQPKTRKDLEALRDFNRPALLSRARELLDLIAEAYDVPDDELPLASERPDDLPGMSMLTSLLNAAMSHRAASHRLSTGLLGTTADLKSLIRWYVEGRPENRTPALLVGWRDEVCGRALLEVLEGRRALRIDDLEAEVPVALEPLDGSEAGAGSKDAPTTRDSGEGTS